MQTSRLPAMRNPFLMPQPVKEEESSILINRNVEDVLEEIETAEKEISREDLLLIVSRVFEHSVEDGLKIAERVKLTPDEYFKVCAHGSFALKHSRIFGQIMSFTRSEKDELAQEYKVLEKAEQTAEQAVKPHALALQNALARKLYGQMEKAYEEVFASRKIKAKNTLSSGGTEADRLSESYLAHLDLALQGGYYSAPIKDYLAKKLDAKILKSKKGKNWQEQIQALNVVTGDEIEQMCQDLKLDAEMLKRDLKSHKYVLYGDLLKYEKGAAVSSLKQDIQKELEEDQKLELNAKTNKYEIVEIESEVGSREVESQRVEIDLSQYETIEHLTDINGVAYFNARQNNKWFIVNAKGEEFGKEYDDANTPVEVNGQLYFRAKQDNKWFIVNAKGEEFGKEYDWAGRPVAINGQLYFGVRQDNKTFIVNAKGEEFGKEYDWAERPVAINGQLYFGAEQNNKWFIVNAQGQKFGEGDDELTCPTDVGGQLYYRARKDGRWFILNCKGEIFGKENDKNYAPVDIGGKLYFSAALNGEHFVTNAKGEKFGTEYDFVNDEIFDYQGRLAYLAEKDGKNILVIEGKPKQEKIKRQELTPEFEKKILDYMEELLKEGVDKDEVARGLAGLDSPRAWELRERLLKEGAHQGSVALGLAGLDSPRAWELRERLLKKGADIGSVAAGLAGLDSPRAWELRERLISEGVELNPIVMGLAGLDSPRAWELRERLIQGGVRKKYVALSLAGLSSKVAWEMRERLLKEVADKSHVARSLVGLDSPRAWEMRERLFNEDFVKHSVAAGLAGLDSPRAWEMRERLSVGAETMARSLVGLDSPRAWEMREWWRVMVSDSVPCSLAGDNVTFVWQLIAKQENAEKKPHIREQVFAEYETIKQLTNINGVAYFCAKKNDKWFIANAKGEEFGKEYDEVGGPVEVNGQLYFRAEQNNKWFIVNAKGEEFGKEYDRADTPVEVNGQLYFNAQQNNKWFIVSVKGEEFGKKYDGVDRIVNVDGVLYFHVIKGGKSLIVNAKGEEFGKEYDEVEYPVMVGGVLYFGADKGGKWFVVNTEGNEFGKEYDNAGYAFNVGGKLYFMADKNSKTFIANAQGEEFGKEYEKVNSYEDVNGNLVFTAMKDGVPVLVKIDVSTGEKNEKLDLLNLVHDPYEQGIKDYFAKRVLSEEEEKRKQRSIVGQSHRVAVMLNRIMREIPEAFLATIGAKRDRASSVLAQKLISKIFPDIFARQNRESKGGGFLGFLGEGTEPSASDPEDYLSFKEFMSFEGGGKEMMNDEREVLEFRENYTGLVVTGLFGESDAGGSWRRTYLPLANRPMGQTKEATVTLPKVHKGADVILPKPLDASLIPERVRGIKKNGAEVELKPEQDSLGMAQVRNLPQVERVAYSINLPEMGVPMENVSAEEYNAYRKKIVNTYGNGMIKNLAIMPEEVDAFLTSAEFVQLSARERVIAIEKFVRAKGFYDFDNGEVAKYKTGKSLEDKMMINEMRVEELRSRDGNLDLKDKLWAGVCADFAELTCAILRRAGFVAGVAQGFALHNEKTAKVKYAHATAFVIWPDALSGNRAVIVDGTPGGNDSRLRAITLPSLEERVKLADEVESKELEESNAILDEYLKILQSGDEEEIRKLQNGKLETALNVILKYGVKQSHADMLREMLSFYWYGGLDRVDEMQSDVDLTKTMEDYLSARRELVSAGAETKPGGKQLFEMVEEFVKKFEKAKVGDYKQALDKLEKIAKLAEDQLEPMEKKAMVAVITYLRGKKMGG